MSKQNSLVRSMKFWDFSLTIRKLAKMNEITIRIFKSGKNLIFVGASKAFTVYLLRHSVWKWARPGLEEFSAIKGFFHKFGGFDWLMTNYVWAGYARESFKPTHLQPKQTNRSEPSLKTVPDFGVLIVVSILKRPSKSLTESWAWKSRKNVPLQIIYLINNFTSPVIILIQIQCYKHIKKPSKYEFDGHCT